MRMVPADDEFYFKEGEIVFFAGEDMGIPFL
jgi:hypothetical protein